MSLTQALQQAILPGEIREVRVGASRVAVVAETEEGLHCGITATLSNKEYNHHTQPSIRNAGHLHEMSSKELAALVDSPSQMEVAVGLAAINALLPQYPSQWVELNAEAYIAEKGVGKNIAVVGHFPFINRLKPQVKNLWVLEINPREEDLPASAAPEVIPQADIVAITATTLINKTFDDLIKLCRSNASVILLGPTTPLSPILFDFGVNILSGTVVEDPAFVTMAISQGVCLHQLNHMGGIRLVTMQKKA